MKNLLTILRSSRSQELSYPIFTYFLTTFISNFSPYLEKICHEIVFYGLLTYLADILKLLKDIL